MAEAFVGTFKRDYVYVNDCFSAKVVSKMIPEWIEDYNNNAPHSALGMKSCLLYTSDAADERSSVDLGGRRIMKKKKKK